MAAVQARTVLTIGHKRANVIKNVRRKRNSFALERRPSAVIIAASKSPNEEPNSNAHHPGLQDVNFLLKLGAGSFAAAATIKYGSIVLPEITRPNITQALIMISTPVIVAVLILIKQSRVEK